MKKLFVKLWRSIKYYLIRIFRLKQGTRQIALGMVMGFYPCWFPTFGIGPAASVALAKFVKANVVGAIVAAALGSFMWPVLFYMNYKTGALFTNSRNSDKEIQDVRYDKDEYIQTIEEATTLGDVGVTFLVGSIINSIVFTIVGYFLIYFIFSRYRDKILRKLRSSLPDQEQAEKQDE